MKEKIKVGNTPMIKINYKYKGKEKHIYTKLEYYNLSGSIKDRVAYYIIKEAYEKGALEKGMTIVEATSGNTGIALSAMGNVFGNPVRIYMPDWVSKERVSLMKMFGAEVILISKEEGGFERAIEEATKYSKENSAFYSSQFENNSNVRAHYETTGKEIIENLNGNIGGFVSGIGTGGTLMGTAKRLKEANPDVKIYALEPDKMPLLSGAKVIGNHKIEGIGDDFIPKIVDKRIIDKVVLINDDDAINMARKIAINLGMGVGISSGANFLASTIANEEVDGNIVTVFVDDNKKYLTTELGKDVDNNKDFLSNKIELLNFEFVN